MKELFKKVVEFFNKAIAYLKKGYAKTVAFLKKYGLRLFNFIVLVLLCGAAWDGLPKHGLVLTIGGLWAVFLVGKATYWLVTREKKR